MEKKLNEKLVIDCIDEVLENLKKQGFEAVKAETYKNTVKYDGIRITRPDESVAPIIYYSNDETVNDFMLKVSEVVTGDYPEFDFDNLMELSYIKKHLKLGIQRKSELPEDLLRKPYLDLELFMKLEVCEGEEVTGFVRMKDSFLSLISVPQKVLWHIATKNSSNFEIQSLASVLGIPKEADFTNPFDVVLGPEGSGGAGVALFYPEIFQEYCLQHEIDDGIYILPSSTEEVLIIPANESVFAMDMAELVREINRQEVDPEQQLNPTCYFYAANSNKVVILAKAQEVDG